MVGGERRTFEGRVTTIPNGEEVRARAEGPGEGDTAAAEVAPIHALYVAPSGANGSRDGVRIG